MAVFHSLNSFMNSFIHRGSMFLCVFHCVLVSSVLFTYFFFFYCLQHTIIPKGSLSLKVLAELPIIVVLMYQVNTLLMKL